MALSSLFSLFSLLILEYYGGNPNLATFCDKCFNRLLYFYSGFRLFEYESCIVILQVDNVFNRF